MPRNKLDEAVILKRRFQFNLRSALVVTAICAACLGIGAMNASRLSSSMEPGIPHPREILELFMAIWLVAVIVCIGLAFKSTDSLLRKVAILLTVVASLGLIANAFCWPFFIIDDLL